MNYLAIDPSVNALGLAVSDGKNWWDFETISPKGNTLPERLDSIRCEIKAVLPIGFTEDVFHLIVEYPQWENSARGGVAAVKGYTLGLSAIAGYLQGAFRVSSRQTFFYTPNQWKGQTPIKGIEYRFLKKFGYSASSEHVAHAAMMLDYHLQQINKLAKTK